MCVSKDFVNYQIYVLSDEVTSMPLLVSQRSSSHGLVATADHQLRNGLIEQQPLDFTMSKFKTSSSRHSLYRQFYASDSPPYEKQEEQGN